MGCSHCLFSPVKSKTQSRKIGKILISNLNILGSLSHFWEVCQYFHLKYKRSFSLNFFCSCINFAVLWIRQYSIFVRVKASLVLSLCLCKLLSQKPRHHSSLNLYFTCEMECGSFFILVHTV